MGTGQICTKGHFFSKDQLCMRVKIIKNNFLPRARVRGNSYRKKRKT